MSTRVTDINTFREILREQQEFNKEGYALFQKLEEHIREARMRIKTNNSSWQEDDARIRALDKMYQIVGGLLMQFIAHREVFANENFYAKNAGGSQKDQTLEEANLSPEKLAECARNAECFLQNGVSSYFNLLFSTVESSIRIFVRETRSHYFGDATKEFKSLYTEFIDDHCFKNKKDVANRLKKILNLSAMVRNTIHNNGVYFNEHDRYPEPIELGRETFTFKYGQPIYLSWDQMRILTEGAVEVVETLIKSEIISSHSSMKDPVPVNTYTLRS